MEQDEFSLKIPPKRKVGTLIVAWLFILMGVVGVISAIGMGEVVMVVIFLIWISLLGIFPMYRLRQPIAVVSKKGIKLPLVQGKLMKSGSMMIPWESITGIELKTGSIEKTTYWGINHFRPRNVSNPKWENPVKYIAIRTDKNKGFVTVEKKSEVDRKLLTKWPSAYIFNERLTDEDHEHFLAVMKKYQTERFSKNGIS